MGLRLVEAGTVERGVRLSVRPPGADAEQECELHCVWMPMEDARAAAEGGDGAFLSKCLAGWSGVEGPDGEPVGHDADGIALVAAQHWLVAAMSRAYFGWLAGLDAKNSATSPPPG